MFMDPYGGYDGQTIQRGRDLVQLAVSYLINGKYLQWHFLYEYIFFALLLLFFILQNENNIPDASVENLSKSKKYPFIVLVHEGKNKWVGAELEWVFKKPQGKI